MKKKLKGTKVALVGFLVLMNWANSLYGYNLTESKLKENIKSLNEIFAISISKTVPDQKETNDYILTNVANLSTLNAPADQTFEGCDTDAIADHSTLAFSTSSQTITLTNFTTDEGGTVSTDCVGGINSITYQDVSDGGTNQEIVTRTFTLTDCDDTQTITQLFTINAPSALNSGNHNTDPITACSNYDPATLTLSTATSGGIAPYNYQWQENGIDIVTATNDTFDPPSILTPGNYNYRVKVTDACGTEVFSSQKLITIVPQATVSVSGEGTICQNQAITLSTSITDGTGNPGYQWESGTTTTGPWTAIPGQTLFNYTPSTATPGTFYYRVNVSFDGAACDNAQSSTNTVVVEPDHSITLSSIAGTNNQTICITSPIANITYAVSGGANNATISGLPPGVTETYSSGTYTINGTPTVSGTFNYTITTSGNTCNIATANGTITINPIPTVNATPSVQTICSGEATSIALSSSVSGATFSWTISETGATGATNDGGNTISQTLTATGTTPGTVTYAIIPTANGCDGSSVNVTITINPTPTVDAISDKVACNGNTSSAIAFSGIATNFTWTNNNINIGLPASGTGNIPSFTAINAGVLPSSANITVTPIYTSGGVSCPGTPESFSIIVYPDPDVIATPNAETICSGNNANISLTSSVSGTVFNWTVITSGVSGASDGTGSLINQLLSITGTTQGTATYSITPSANGCSGLPIQVVITVNPTPIFTVPSDQTYCPGITTSSVPLNGNPSGTVFDISGGASIGLADQVDVTTIPSFTTIAGTAIITITPKADGCPGSPQSASYTVQDTPTAGSIDDSQSICPNTLPATFHSVVDGSGSGIISYIWESSIDGGTNWLVIAGANNSSYTSPSLTQTTQFRRTTVSLDNGVTCNSNPSNIVEVIAFDDEPATFSAPADITVFTDGSCSADITTASTGTVTDQLDNCTAPGDLVISYTDGSQTAGSCTGSYSFTRDWTVVDNELNSDTKSQLITVADNTIPIVSPPPTISISCEDSIDPTDTGQATATDNCDTNPTITYTDVTTAGSCSGNYTITRSWIATDCSGNISLPQTQTINVFDNTDPVVTISDKSVSCPDDIPASYTSLAEFQADGGTVIDNCGTLSISLASEIANGLDGQPGYCPSSLTRTYRFEDECGNYFDAIQEIYVTSDCGCSPCTVGTNFHLIDMLGDATANTVISDQVRVGKCCGARSNDRCISFNIRLDNDAVGLEILIDGATPVPHEWDVDCEDVSMNDGVVCIPGGAFHLFTFCKPGANANDYSFRSIPGIIASDDISSRVDCSGQIQTDGITGSPVWTSVWPGTRGQYDSYLSSTTVEEPIFTADASSPPEIHYEVCADIGSTVCNALGTDCDTIAVYVHQKIDATFNTDPSSVCENNIPELVADVSPVGATYIYEWYTGSDAIGSPFLTGVDRYTPSTEGLYSLKITDTEAGIPCSSEIFNFEVIFDETGIANFDFPAGDLEIECNTANASQLIQNWLALATATDYDGSPVAVNNDYTGITQACGTELAVTFSAQDVCGNLGDSIAYIRIVDTQNPVVNSPAIDSDTECDGTDPNLNGGFLAWIASNGGANITDACDPNLTWTNNSASQTWSGDPANNTITVTLTATDDCGNSISSGSTYTITDTQAPTITCPGDISETAGANNCDKSLTTLTDPTIYDFCSTPSLSWTMAGATTGSGSGTVTGESFNVGTTSVTYTVTDAAGLTATCNFDVSILDVVPPVFDSGCPLADIGPIDAENGVCDAFITVPVPSVSDPCSEGYTIVNDFNGTADASGRYPVGTTIVNWTITDTSGNPTTCAQNIIVTDNQAPVFTTCPSDVEQTAGPNNCYLENVTITDPTFTDNCPNPVLTYELLLPDGSTTSGTGSVNGLTFNVGVTTVTYTLTDAAGLTDVCQFDVWIKDIAPPEFSSGCPTDVGPINAEAGVCDAFVTVPAPSVDDPCNEGYTLVNDFTGTDNASARYPVGTTTIIWTITDASGNPTTCPQDITVVDNQAPVFTTCPSDVEQTAGPNNCFLNNVTITDPTFTDNCSSPVLTYELLLPDGSTTTGSGSVSGLTFNVGITTVTYTLTDAAGLPATCQFNVWIKDIVPPEFSSGCPTDVGPINADANLCDAFVTVPAPSVDDPCNEGYTLVNDFTGTDNASARYPVGTTTITWTITDASGNPTTCPQNITVVDNQIPVFTSCPTNVEEIAGSGNCYLENVTITDPTFTDNCPNPVLTYELLLPDASITTGTGSVNGLTFNVGVTTVTYTITDAAGLTDDCQFEVWIKDIVPPVFDDGCPLASPPAVDAAFDACEAFVTVPVPAISDPCNEGFTLTNNSPFKTSDTDASGTYPVGSTTFTWTVTDASGNISTCDQTIIVNVTMSLDNPGPQTLCEGELTAPIALTGAPAGTIFDVTGGSSIGLSDLTDITEIPAFIALAGTATLTITPKNSCIGIPVTFDITVNPAPNVTAIPPYPIICSGETTNIELINPIPSTTFSWVISNMSPSGSITGASDGSGNLIAQTLTNTTLNTATVTYLITPTANSCGGAQLSVTATVLPEVSATISGGATLCQDDASPTITFESTGGTAPYTFSYNINGGASQQITTSSGNSVDLTIPTNTAGTYNYNLESISDIDGCIYPQTGTVIIVINPTPTLTSSLAPSGVCSSELFSYTPTANLSGTTFNWSRAVVSGISNPSESGTDAINEYLINTTNNPIAVTYEYSLTANGCTNIEQVVVMVTPTPILISPMPTDPLCSGDNFSYSPSSNVLSGVNYNWSRPAIAGNPTASGTGTINEILINNTGGNIGINYTYELSSNDCVNPVTYTVPVVVVPAPNVTVSASSTTICNGEGINLFSSSDITSTSPPTLLSEDFNSASVGSTTGPNGWTTTNTSSGGNTSIPAWTIRPNNYVADGRTFSSNDNSQFYFSDSDSQGSGTNTRVTLVSPQMNTVGYTNLQLEFYHYYRHYGGSNPKVEVSTNGTNWSTIETYNFTQGSSSSFTHESISLNGYIGNSIFYIRFNYEANWGYYWAIDNVSVTGTPSAAADVSWTSSPAGYTSTDVNPTNVYPTETTTYTASYTDPDTGCDGIQSVTVTVRDIPDATISADYCINPPFIRLSTGSFSSYSWEPDGQTTQSIDVDIAGNYKVTVTDANGCEGSATIYVGNELVVNGDFSSGNTGFSSDYTYYPDIAGNNELVPDTGTDGYGIGTNGQNYHGNFWGIDHTENATGNRNFMLVNGHGTITIWEQTVNVEPNTDYYFSAWAMSLNNVGPYAELQFEVNGSPIGTVANLSSGPSNSVQANNNNYWTRFYSNPKWNSGALSGPISIRIINNENAANGNDFGLDDISFGSLDPSPAEIAPTSNNEICAGDTIKLYANITGGKDPINFSWTGPNGFTSTDENPIIPDANEAYDGTYTLNVTDGYGCGIPPATTDVQVNSLPTVEAGDDFAVCSETPDANLNGSIGVSASSATWSGGNGSFAPTTTTLNAVYTPTSAEITIGTVKLYLTSDDPAGACDAVIDSVLITINPSPEVSLIPTDPECNGGNDGNITTTVTSGTAPFTYLWSDGQTTETASDLTAGTYSVIVTDAFSCEAFDTITLAEPPSFVLDSITFTEPSCFGANDGTATVHLSGGTEPYVYTWNAAAGSQTTATATNLTAGAYTVQVTDANTCAGTSKLVVLTQPLPPSLDCPNDTVLFADYEKSFASGVTIPAPEYLNTCLGFSLIWEMNGATTGTGNSDPSGINLLPILGTYNVGLTTVTYTLSDAYGNNTTCSFTITVEAEPDISCVPNIEQDTDAGVCTATINPGIPILNSGALPVSWNWELTDSDNNIIDSGTGLGISPNPYTFDLGTTTIRWIASNVSGADTCYQSIIINDNEQPTFTSSPITECVDNLILAQFASSNLNISPDPDHYTFKSGNTSLDITAITDNCCNASDMTTFWRIDFTDTPDPNNQPAGVISRAPINGTGQPSNYGSDIMLWGDGVNFTTVTHTITYWIEDCNGNSSDIQVQNITVTPRPNIIMN